ncbi:MAG: hypothetical protein WAM14_10845 [Candidatus Nitrosopolaris sp.]
MCKEYPNTDLLSTHAKDMGELFHGLEPVSSNNADPTIYDVEYNSGIVFKIKKPIFDPKGAVDGF